MVCEGVRAVFHLAACRACEVVGDRFGDYLACNVLGTSGCWRRAPRPTCPGWCSPRRPASTGRVLEASQEGPAVAAVAVRGVEAGGRAAVLAYANQRARPPAWSRCGTSRVRPSAAPGHGVQPDHAGRAVRPGDVAVRDGRPAPRLHLRLRRGRRDDRAATVEARAEVVTSRPAQRAAVRGPQGDCPARGHRGARAAAGRPARHVDATAATWQGRRPASATSRRWNWRRGCAGSGKWLAVRETRRP